MAAKRQERGTIRAFVLANVEAHPQDIARVTAEKFGISRQAANRHLKSLVDNKQIIASGKTRQKRYELVPIAEKIFNLEIIPGLSEDTIWRRLIEPLLVGVKENVLGICQYGFTEMVNNIIDHSESSDAVVRVSYTISKIEFVILDHGIGVFEKITKALGLEDYRHAILELTKGKVTTDPEHHTGEGVFFTCRMFDRFSIRSGDLYFSHFEDADWLIETQEEDLQGTYIEMEIDPNSERTTKEIFDRFATEHDDYGFTRTHVPVRLAIYEGEKLVSRSQAKRLLGRFDRFKEVFLDFDGVETIGPAFADEIFRVFAVQHPDTNLVCVNASEEVDKMIHRALSVNDVNGKSDSP
jgi:anti-sigma regulatory factor (Ser/Thr protein kinase)